MFKQKGNSDFLFLAVLVMCAAFVGPIVYKAMTAPELVGTETTWETVTIKVTKFDPSPRFSFNYINNKTGEEVGYYVKTCSRGGDEKKVKVGNEYRVRLQTDTATFEDGTKRSVLVTDGCDLMDQIP